MEFNRSELKDRAKALISRNYWGMVAAGLIMAVATGAIVRTSTTYTANEDTVNRITALSFIMAVIVSAATIAFTLFVLHPLEFGAAKYFTRNIDGQAQGTLFDGFKQENFAHAVSVYFYRNVMIGLFLLLLVIPGIIKAYEYYFVSFLAVDYPELSGRELCEMSKKMTEGSKTKLFMLDLSFLLWHIANTLTCNLVGIFYYYPYRYQTKANAYRLFMERSAGAY